MAILLEIDENTTLEMEPASTAEGQIAGVGEDIKYRIDQVIEQTKKVALKIRKGLVGLGPSEIQVTLGFKGGHNYLVLSGEGSVNIKVKWTNKGEVDE
jgi:hypothetical protein